jgi:hypothetical protein
MSKKLKKKDRISIKLSEPLKLSIMDLVAGFEVRATKAGLTARDVDAHVASIAINMLCDIVAERQTYTASQISKMVKKELGDAEREENEAYLREQQAERKSREKEQEKQLAADRKWAAEREAWLRSPIPGEAKQ